MKRCSLYYAWIILILVLSASMSMAQHHSGGRGLLYVHSARALPKGSLNSYFHSRFFGDVGKFSPKYIFNSFWNVQASLAVNYGLTDRFEFSLLPIIYQDTNRSGKGYNLPDDLFLKLKYGSLASPSSRLQYGALLSTRVPLGKTHNVVLEPYSAGTIEVGITGLVSYASDVLFPDESFNVHLNLGFLSHNDAGSKLSESSSDTLTNNGITSELTFGFGFRYPFEWMKFRLEMNGNYFLSQPAETAYGRENYLYLTPALSYKISSRWWFDLAMDLRLSKDIDETAYGFIEPTPERVPGSYPNWRATIALKFDIFPVIPRRIFDREFAAGQLVTRREQFERLVHEMQEQNKAEEELERIAKERLEAEKAARQARPQLEGTGKKKENQP